MHRNLPKSPPWFPSQAGQTLRRSGFLGGQWRTYFGPGHHHNVVDTYFPPTDWPGAGTLLRMPQVVWLSLWFKYGAGPASWSTTWSNYFRDTRYSSVVSFRDIVGPWYFGGGPYTTVERNPDIAGRSRIVDVYAEAKSQIERVRPGRTWVQVIDWNDRSVAPGDHPKWDGFVPIVGPPSVEPGTYLATDFANVWAGHCPWTRGGTLQLFDVYVPPDPVDDDPYYGWPKARLVRGFGAFPRYAAWYYAADDGWGDPSPAPPPDGYGQAFFGPVGMQDNATAAGQLSLFAGDLRDYGVEYAGGASSLNARGLIALIAGHYGFDPDTGKDLP